MRILVLADIHGNKAALGAVRESADAVLCLGDLVDYGPDPGACVEWVRANADHCVRGNHDHGVAQDVPVRGGSGFRYLTGHTRPHSVAAVTAAQRRYLAGLPTSRFVSLGGKRILMVHATPRDPMDEFAPPDPEFWGPLVDGLGADFVLAGHTHQPYVLRVGETTVVNPGSVGLTRDGDPRASYAVIEDGVVKLRRVEYPVEETVAASAALVADPLARRMLTDTYRGGGLVAKWAQCKAANGACPAPAGGPAMTAARA
jgi:putative phosphoesterase